MFIWKIIRFFSLFSLPLGENVSNEPNRKMHSNEKLSEIVFNQLGLIE